MIPLRDDISGGFWNRFIGVCDSPSHEVKLSLRSSLQYLYGGSIPDVRMRWLLYILAFTQEKQILAQNV